MLQTFGIWVAAGLTLALYSFLWKENPVYRVAEHLYVGMAAGYGVVTTIDSYIRPTLKNDLMRDHKFIVLIPIILGILIYARYIRSISYLARWAMAFWLGVGAGMVLTRDFRPYFIVPITSTFKPLWVAGKVGVSINNIIFVVGVVTTLMYFFFTVKRVGVLDHGARFGRWVMMVAFGAAFGNTVMARVSLFLGRMQFLLGDWLHLIKS